MAKKPVPRRKSKGVSLADAGKLLRGEDQDTLVKMLLDWAKDDDRLHERLILYAARLSQSDAGTAAVRWAFEAAVEVEGFVDYREAYGWADEVDHAIDSIQGLLDDGHAAAAVEVCESALQSLLEAIQSVDDSDGHFAGLSGRLQDIHYRASLQAKPDPVDLAGRLFQAELNSAFDVFDGAAEKYKRILGAKGMKAFRELAEAEWSKVPTRTAKSHSTSGRYFRITRIMESLARVSGDIEELVAVMSRDRSSAYYYWRIAEVYREARLSDRALLWVEKGLQEFPKHTDSRLREFAAEEYHRRRRHEDAMKVMWVAFEERPFPDEYKILKKHALKAGAWPEWRDRALAAIRRRIAKDNQDHSVLVEIFFYEGTAEDAWREAGAGGCSDGLWLRLAAMRENEHPEDAAPIYLKYGDAGVARGGGDYEESVGLLVKAAAAMKRVGRSAEFERHLDGLLAQYKIKRNFVKLVEKKRHLLRLE